MSLKAFVLLSGGVDSSTCLAIAADMFDEVECISVDYGQKHRKEMEFAKAQASVFGASHKILNIEGILSGDGVMLTDADTEIPDIDYADIEGVSPTYVPYRNGVLLSLITAQAQKWVMGEIERRKAVDLDDAVGAKRLSDQEYLDGLRDSCGIFFGAHAEDAHNWAYPDCTPEFIGAQANAIYTGTYYTARLFAPLASLSKAQVVEWGNRLGLDYGMTWSCYVGREKHCGVCPTCRSRKDAFRLAGVVDPTEYAE